MLNDASKKRRASSHHAQFANNTGRWTTFADNGPLLFAGNTFAGNGATAALLFADNGGPAVRRQRSALIVCLLCVCGVPARYVN